MKRMSPPATVVGSTTPRASGTGTEVAAVAPAPKSWNQTSAMPT